MKRITFAAISAFLCVPCFAEELNIEAEAIIRLFDGDKGLIEVPETGGNLFCNIYGAVYNKDKSKNDDFKCSVGVKNIRVTEVSTEYSTIKPAPIPISVIKDVRTFVNCKSDSLDIKESITLERVEGNIITKKTTLSKETANTQNLSITIPVVGITFGSSLDQKLTFGTTSDTTTELNKTETTKTEREIAFKVNPLTIANLVFEQTISNGYIDFVGSVKINGDAYLRITARPGITPQEKTLDLGYLSYLIFPPNKQIFQLSGQIWNVKYVGYRRYDLEEPITTTDPRCRLQEAAKPSVVAEVKERTRFAEIKPIREDSPKPFSASSNNKVSQSLPVGTSTIRTSDSVGNVYVRAKSQGPGFCATELSTSSKKISLAAPPFAWSSWTVLDSHIGAVTMSITAEVLCDTGALFEVQYYK